MQAIKMFLNAIEVEFEIRNENLPLAEKIKAARQEKENEQLKIVNPKNIWQSIS
jgi:hypothetical protein